MFLPAGRLPLGSGYWVCRLVLPVSPWARLPVGPLVLSERRESKGWPVYRFAGLPVLRLSDIRHLISDFRALTPDTCNLTSDV